jgi:type I restriction-modification system DNA methylase subunit
MKEKAYYIANKARQILGGTLSANQCRDYVLALLFLKSASEYYKSNDSFQQDDNYTYWCPSVVLLIIYVKRLIHRILVD